MHRRISMIAVVFLGIHVVTSVLDTYVNISWAAIVIPFTSSYGRFWVGVGAIALDLMIAVFVTSLLRARMRPGTWRAVHWLAYLSWPVALAHTFGMGTDSREGWVIVLGRRVRRVRRVRRWSGGCAWSPVRPRRRTAHASVPGVPPKHLALTGRQQGRVPSCLASARPSPPPGATGCSAIRPTWPATWRRLVPSRCRRRPAPGLARGVRVGARGLGPGGPRWGRVSRPPSSWPWRTPPAAAAPSWSTPWRASRRATRTSSSSSARRTSCWTAPSSWPRRAVRGGSSCACPRVVGRWPRPSRTAMDERVSRGLRSRPRGPGAAARPLRRRRGVGLGALGRIGSVPPVLPPGQGHRPAHRPQGCAGAQRGDAGARRHDRPHRSGRVPGPRAGRGPRDLPRHHLGCGRTPRAW